MLHEVCLFKSPGLKGFQAWQPSLGFHGMQRRVCDQAAYLKSCEIGLNCDFTLENVIFLLTFLTLSKMLVLSPFSMIFYGY